MLDQSPDAAAHLRALIACRSVTPADDGAQDYLAGVLGEAGFRIERLTFSAPGTPDVHNLFATIGSGAPHLLEYGEASGLEHRNCYLLHRFRILIYYGQRPWSTGGRRPLHLCFALGAV